MRFAIHAVVAALGISVCLMTRGWQIIELPDTLTFVLSGNMGLEQFGSAWSHGVPALAETAVTKQYDYIVVGAGAAGSLIARRLGDSGKDVLVLEKGVVKEGLMKAVPAAVLKMFFHPGYDYMLKSNDEKHLNGKSIYLIRGKMVGGSSGINVMLYHRGTARDYDAYWPEGWKSKDVLTYFKQFEKYQSKVVGQDSEVHGYSGELTVEDGSYRNILSDAFFESAIDLGAMPNNDFSNWSRGQFGVGKFQLTSKAGKRQDGYLAFLKDAPSRHVTLLTGVAASAISFDYNNTATGVSFTDEAGKTHLANVKGGGEVVLAAGAVMSPELLLSSGIGPEEDLLKSKVAPRVNLPGVGLNLQDHPAVTLTYNVATPASVTDDVFLALGSVKTPFPKPTNIVRWFWSGEGPLSSVGCEQGGFFKTKEDLVDPDLQIRFVPGRGLDPDGVESYRRLGKEPAAGSGITLQIIAIRPQSKGQVKLQNASVPQQPGIHLNYLDASEDRRTLREGLRLARQIVAQQSLQKHVTEEVWPGEAVQTDDELDRYISKTIHSANALVGTCKMGLPDDKLAVVDTSLRVYGTKQLRVVDASVFPKIPGGQTVAPTYMVAEKAADMILKEAGKA